MRLAYLHGAAIPSRAASTVQVMKMCDAFARLGHAVMLIVPNKPDTDRGVSDMHAFYGVSPLVQIVRASWPPLPGKSYLSAIDMARRAYAHRPDVVYSRFVLAGFAAAARGLRVIHEIHRPVSDMNFGERLAYTKLIRHPRFAYTVAISDALRAACEAEFPQLRGKIVVAHDGADPPSQSIAPRAEAATTAGRMQVGYVGSLYPGKGADLVHEIARSYPGADFHVIGGSAAEVRALGEAANGVANFRLHGFLPHPQAQDWIARFDVVLAPYGSKVGIYGDMSGDVAAYMSPLKLFEYMAAGRAIVCSDHDVLREVVTDGVTALVCQRGLVSSWCEALARLDREPLLRKQLGDAARAEFLIKYTWSARATRVLAPLQESETYRAVG